MAPTYNRDCVCVVILFDRIMEMLGEISGWLLLEQDIQQDGVVYSGCVRQKENSQMFYRYTHQGSLRTCRCRRCRYD